MISNTQFDNAATKPIFKIIVTNIPRNSSITEVISKLPGNTPNNTNNAVISDITENSFLLDLSKTGKK